MRKLFKERKLFKGGNYMRKYGILLCSFFRERHMIVDVSWSLGEDYEQDYEESRLGSSVYFSGVVAWWRGSVVG